MIIEDAAQSVFAKWRGQAPGAIGHLGTFSFHETKNLGCGEGGALLINDPAFIERAEVLLEKGTNRTRFVRGEIGSYEWVDVGSSFLMSDLTAAILGTQLDAGEQITSARRAIWAAYHSALEPLEDAGLLTRPALAADVEHNGHIYWALAPDHDTRDAVLGRMREDGVRAQFHYVPLHSAPAGRQYGRTAGSLDRTTDLASRLVRLPVWAGMTDSDVELVIASAIRAFAPSRRVKIRAA
jgi:dTDP-4-amino-4,6-dideoxygalactose transaminase